MMEPNHIDVQITNKANFDSFERANIISYLGRFADKASRTINTGKIEAYIKEHNKKYRGVPVYYCTVKFWTDKGVFYSKNQDYGYIPTLHGALLKIKKAFNKKRERSLPKLVSHQLKKLKKFPAMI